MEEIYGEAHKCEEEVATTIKGIKNGNSAGSTGALSEMMKASGGLVQGG